MSELYKVVPIFVPKPRAWGKFKLEKPATYFFLCDFVEMDKCLPDPEAFCSQVAELHRISKSATGMFGFPIRNCQGKFLQENEWDPSWTSFFTRLLVNFFKLDIAKNGAWPEYQRAFDKVVQHVIPKLLEPLQSNGRSLKPSLVHGDLWHGNAATNHETGNPVAFDAAAFYAHNEYELGTWRRKTVEFDNTYFGQYAAQIPPSEPVEQWDDRIRLYSLKFNLAHITGWPVVESVREEIYNDMLYLVGNRLSLGPSSSTNTANPSSPPLLRDLDQPFIYDIRIYNRPYRFEFFDTASPTHYTLLSPDFVIICFDISSRTSLVNAKEVWRKGVSTWFVGEREGRVPVMLLGLKRDERREDGVEKVVYPQE
ncbi:MAG: hypothetical protein Q9214_003918, partial [Letrouitia sp. 1 TL-2023]